MSSAAELELLRLQRAQLATRLEAPAWYVAATAFAWAVAFAMPFGSRYVLGGGAWCALAAIVIFVLAQYALARVSGVYVGARSWQFPATRVWTIAMVVVILAASAAETLLLDRGLLPAAIVVAVFATVAGTGCRQGQLHGIRHDLQTGEGGA
jgi:hypothetical protein